MSARTPPAAAARTAAAALARVVAPLALGGAFYLALRAPDIRLFAWARALGLGGAVEILRAWAAPLRLHVPAFALGSLPDAAWAWAFGAALALVWGRLSAWTLAGAAATAALELGQAAHVVPGTFDPVDLAAMLAGYLAGAACGARGLTASLAPSRAARAARARTGAAGTSSSPRRGARRPSPT